jgi:type IV pilus assembly protein PilA
LPAYQDYIARGQAAESVVLLDGARTNIEDYASSNGAFPNGTAGTDAMVDLGIQATGTYGTLSEPVKIATDDGTITYTFNATGVNSGIAGKKVVYWRQAANAGWLCDSAGGTASPVSGNLPTKYSPKGCQ